MPGLVKEQQDPTRGVKQEVQGQLLLMAREGLMLQRGRLVEGGRGGKEKDQIQVEMQVLASLALAPGAQVVIRTLEGGQQATRW